MLRTKKKGSNRNPWFTESCRDLRNTVKNYEKLVNKYPQNTEYRHKFYSFRSKFRRLCKFEENKYKEKKCSELSDMLKLFFRDTNSSIICFCTLL
jgi:hypothetical protein